MAWVSPGQHEGPAETIGQRLRRLRHERGLSQRELAGPGVSYAYISRIEAGARRPSVKALRMLARKLGVSADYLETGSEIRDTDERELQIADAELELRLAEVTEEAESKLTRLLEDALAAGDRVAGSRANIALGFAAANRGRNGDAIERLEAGLQQWPVSPGARPDVYATLGRAYAASGDPARAVELFERCLESVSQEVPDDFAAQIRYTTYLSYALTDAGDLRRAEEVLEEAIGKAEMTDAYSRVRLYWSIARLNEIGGRPAAALDYIRRAIALLDVTDDTLHLARAHMLCGSIMLSQGRAEEAGRHQEIAERLFGPNAEPEDLSGLYADESKRATVLGDADLALRKAEAAVAAVSADEYPHEKGRGVWALAEARALGGDLDGAHTAFRESTLLLEAHGHRRDYVEAYRSWGMFLRRAGREDEALEVLERAADLASEPAGETQTPQAQP